MSQLRKDPLLTYKAETVDSVDIIGAVRGQKQTGTVIELSDILHSLNRVKGKVHPTLVMSQEKAGWFTIPKEKNKDYLTQLMKRSEKSVAPNHYKRHDLDLFKKEGKNIHFFAAKAAKHTIFGEESKRKAFVPGSNKYTPQLFYRTIGTIKL